MYTKLNSPRLVFLKMHYVYKITNKINNKFYIGKHTQEIGRIDKYCGTGTNIKRAVKKYGIKNFTKEIISFYDTYCLAYEGEKHTLTTEVVNDNLCYNMRPGGMGGAGGVPRSDETKQKISNAHKGKPKSPEHCAAMSKGQTGKTLSQETKKKLSIRFSGKGNNMYGKGHMAKGRKHTAESKEKMRISMLGDKNPNYGKKEPTELLEKKSTKCSINGFIYCSLHEASRQLNVSRQTISHRCKSPNVLFKDYYYV